MTKAVVIFRIMVKSLRCAGATVPSIETGLCGNPALTFRVLEESIDVGRSQGSGIAVTMKIIGERKAIILRQSIHGGKPHKTIGILRDVKDMILRKTIIVVEVFKQSSSFLC